MIQQRKAKLRIALLGCGAVSRLYYAPALRQLEAGDRLRVVAVLDPDLPRAAQVRENFPGASTLTNISQLLEQDFDIGIVASPHSVHAEQTLALLARGISVLCEKPMATSLADAQAMTKAASTSSGVLAIGMLRRFFPATETIRQMLRLEVLGEITSFNFSEGNAQFHWPVASPAYFRKRESQGGVLMDIGVHALDLMVWWLGKPADVVYEDDAMGGIEVNCRLHCTYTSGLAGEVRLSRDCALANRYTIRGTKGWISWPVNEANTLEVGFGNARYSLRGCLHQCGNGDMHTERGSLAFNFEQSFVSQICNVIDAVSGTAELQVPAADGIESLSLIEQCYANRSLLEMSWLSESETARAHQLRARSE